MHLTELLILGVALAMDAMAVTLSNALCEPNMKRSKAFAMPISFGIFQGLMPLIGFFLGTFFSDLLTRHSAWAVFAILAFLGARMIKEGYTELKEPGSCEMSQLLTYKTLILQAVATSIDAMAVGVSLAAVGANIFAASAIIALVTCVCCFFSLALGSRLGLQFGPSAEIAGGSVLLMIAIKALLS